jgi:hypothetical protein
MYVCTYVCVCVCVCVFLYIRQEVRDGGGSYDKHDCWYGADQRSVTCTSFCVWVSPLVVQHVCVCVFHGYMRPIHVHNAGEVVGLWLGNAQDMYIHKHAYVHTQACIRIYTSMHTYVHT